MPRYQARFTNGVWQTFDTLQYCAVDVHWTRKEADQAVTLANDWSAQQRKR